MIDSNDLHREQDALHAHASNLRRMLEGCRSKGAYGNSGFTYSVVRMTCDAYRNALDAAMATISEVETECLLICAQREGANAAYDILRRLPPVRPSVSLPAVVSPCAAE